MYAIETELGRFEADDEKGAKKLLRAAERKHAQEQGIKNANRNQAGLIARSTAYRYMSVDPSEYSPHWYFFAIGSRGSAPIKSSRDYQSVIIQTADDGNVEIPFYRPSIDLVGTVQNMAGYTELIFVRQGKDSHCYAVGVCNGEYALAICRGVSPENFANYVGEQASTSAA